MMLEPEAFALPVVDANAFVLPIMFFDAQGEFAGGNKAGCDLMASPAAIVTLARLATGPQGQLQPVSIDGKRFLAAVGLSLGQRAVILAPQADDIHVDPLTGLQSRAGLEASSANGNFASYAVHCIDLDRFKFVNDSLGHPTGDCLLRMVGARLRKLCGETDIGGRLGGDEFVIVQSLSDGKSANRLAGRLVDLLSRTYIIDGNLVNVGASVGVAMGEKGSTLSNVIANADLALYEAKRNGRGCYRFFDQAMKQAMLQRRDMETALRAALALDEFRLVYQPQVSLASGLVEGFEALLRWTRTCGTSVSPAVFIPIAEEMGLMPAIGEWVLRTAARDAASWPQDLSVSVNVSPLQFRDTKLADKIVSAVAAAGLLPTRLDLEITEGALLHNTEDVIATLQVVKSLGITVSMDDFGTGYSSLSYLQKFPFDKVKIDQSFIRGESSGTRSAALIKAVAAIGASLGMATVAEGVETPEHLSMVQTQGVTLVQGYLTGKPMPDSEILNYLKARK